MVLCELLLLCDLVLFLCIYWYLINVLLGSIEFVFFVYIEKIRYIVYSLYSLNFIICSLEFKI